MHGYDRVRKAVQFCKQVYIKKHFLHKVYMYIVSLHQWCPMLDCPLMMFHVKLYSNGVPCQIIW